MSDREAPTNADLMARLDAIAAGYEKHEKRITALEADRAIVHRLATHVSEISGEVRVIHDLLSKTEDVMSKALRLAGRELSSEVTATVRAELSGLRGEVRELRESVRARPCLVGECVITAEPTPSVEPKE